MNGLPAVVLAEYRGDFKIWIVFNDGVDGTVAWPSGADIAPETLHARAKVSAAD